MVSRRTAYRGSFALLAALALLCASATSAWATHVTWTPPTLASPDGNSHFTEGDSVTLGWTGALQGDVDTIATSSYFRVEIASQGDVPAGQQSAWTQTVYYTITDPGASTTSVEVGVPVAGVYEWRVCAWGVDDNQLENKVEQLAGGCTQGRALTADEAVAPVEQDPDKLVIPGTTRTIQGADNVIEKITTTNLPADPADNKVITLPRQKSQKPSIDASALGAAFGDGSDSSVSLGNEGLPGGGSSGELGGAFGVLAKGLGASLPGVPIPFWSLALLLVAVPFTMWWGRWTLGMFEWPDEQSGDSSALDVPEGIKPDGESADGPTTRDHTAAGGRLAA